MTQFMKKIQRQTCMMLVALLLIGGLLSSYGGPVQASETNDNIVISQVYGAGGNGSGASYRYDFVELHNPTDHAISLDGLYLLYGSATNTTWPTVVGSTYMALSGSVDAGDYYLIQQASGADTTAPSLPAPDAFGSMGMGGASGKLKLMNSEGETVDLVGYGLATVSENAPTGTALSNVAAAIRKPLNVTDRGKDTDDNSTDFTTGTPSPRNSTSVGVVEAQPGSGVVTLGEEVSLTTWTVGASVYYRVNPETPSAEYLLYSHPIEITEDMTIDAYADKAGKVTSAVTSFNFTVSGISTIAAARQLAVDTSVLIEGIVTHKELSGGLYNLYVQDETAAIVVRGPGLTAEVGDKIKASGIVSDYYGLAQLVVETSNVTITEEEAGVPAATLIDSTGFTAGNGEAIEAKLVKVNNVTAGASNSFNEFTVTDELGTMIVKSAALETGKQYELITGVVTYSYGNYMLIPRSAADVNEKVLSVLANPSPTDLIQSGTMVTLSTPAGSGKIYYTVDGSVPAAVEANEYEAAFVINQDTVVKAIVVVDGTTSEVFTFPYVIQKTYDGLKIHDIQAASHVSPYAGHTVTNTSGIVTMKRSDGKWFLQAAKVDWDTNDATSEAILIEPKAAVTVNIGDQVTVSGTVQEVKETGYDDSNDLKTTQIAASAITVNAGGVSLPEPIVIGVDRIQPITIIDNDGMSEFDPEEDALDFNESLEGMRVQLNDARIIGPFSYETPVVLGEQPENVVMTPAGGIMLTDNGLNPQRILIAKEPTQKVKTGDTFNDAIIGVMSYDYSNYKVITGSLPDITASSNTREVTSLVNSADKLTAASFNIENFWNNPSAAEAARKDNIAKAIVTNLKSPDIVALVEVQDNNGATNDGTTDASASFEALISAIADNGGPTYSYTDIAPENNADGGAPGGNIRVGYLYNEQRVTLVEKADGKGSATTAVSYGEDGLSHNPGRIAPTNEAFDDSRKPLAAEFEFKGEQVIVIANHFNSKGGDEAPYGATQPLPATLGSEVQRHKIATVVNEFVQSIYDENAKANIILLGDLNDFQFSKTLELTKGNVLTNMVDTMPENERYSYVYQGNSQTLDHILVDKKLASFADIDIVHINADFDTSQGRVSDHDPLLIQVDLAAKEDALFAMTLMHVNDTHAHLETVAQRITAIKEVRKEVADSILLDAGDVFSGTLFFNKYLGHADLEFMNYIGYDAMVFGNHEFDKGPEVLADFIKEADFPFVSSNIDFSTEPAISSLVAEQALSESAEDGKIYDAIVLDVGGEKVGVFGLTTEDTKFLASPGENIKFENYITQAEQTVQLLQNAGINKIIALTHLGHEFDKVLAESVDGIDVIVGGHSHTNVPAPVVFRADSEPTLVVQGEDYGKYLGRLDLEFSDTGVLTKWNGRLLAASAYTADPTAVEMLKPFQDGIAEIQRQIIGKTDVLLDGERTSVRVKETNLGDLMADGMRKKVMSIPEFQAMDVKGFVAIQNGGGIRASIKKTAAGKTDGDITLGELLTMMPFGNNLTALRMTGQEIVDALENGVSGIETGQGRFPQVSGMRFYYDTTKQPEVLDANGVETQEGKRIIKVEIKNDNGKFSAIDLNAYYFVATNSFMANGGDFYRSMKQAKDSGRQHEMNIVDYEVFWEYLTELGTVTQGTEGRIIDLKGEALPGTGNGNNNGNNGNNGGNSGNETEDGNTEEEVPVENPSPTVSFSDVGSHWAAKAIDEAINKGFIKGYGDGTFRPNATATRAEFVTMVGRALELEATDASLNFADAEQVPAWARSFFAVLVKDEVISGYEDQTLRPSSPLTRTEMTVILVRALGITVDPKATVPFADANDIPGWAQPYIAAAYHAGLVKGMGGNRFSPNSKATRAEVVTLLLSALEYAGKE